MWAWPVRWPQWSQGLGFSLETETTTAHTRETALGRGPSAGQTEPKLLQGPGGLSVILSASSFMSRFQSFKGLHSGLLPFCSEPLGCPMRAPQSPAAAGFPTAHVWVQGGTEWGKWPWVAGTARQQLKACESCSERLSPTRRQLEFGPFGAGMTSMVASPLRFSLTDGQSLC